MASSRVLLSYLRQVNQRQGVSVRKVFSNVYLIVRFSLLLDMTLFLLGVIESKVLFLNYFVFKV